MHAGVVLEAVNGADVRVVERREHLRLALEPRETIGVARECLGQHLQRDVAIELRVARTPHLAHAAGTEQCDDFITTKNTTGGYRHTGSGGGLYQRALRRPCIFARRIGTFLVTHRW